MRQVSHSIYNLVKALHLVEALALVEQNQNCVALLLACNADDNDEPLVAGKYRSPHCLNNVKKLAIKYVASIISWITTMVLGEYLMQLDRKMDAKNKKPTFP
jgi:hypothetical protein